MNGYCGFGDCFAAMLGFALLGVGAGVGVTYLAAQNKKRGWTKKLGRKFKGGSPEPEPEVAGYRRSRRRSLRGCGCGG